MRNRGDLRHATIRVSPGLMHEVKSIWTNLA